MAKVLIAQPTRMHTHQLARALFEAGHLVYFFSLLPDSRQGAGRSRWAEPFSSRFDYNRLDFLPPSQCRFRVGPLVLQKLTYNNRSLFLSRLGELAAWSMFDRWVARSLQVIEPDLVIGYEMSSATTFVEGRRLGIPCVLDAAASHYALQLQWLEEERRAATIWPGRRLVYRKQREIEAANLIMTCSPQSAQSYVDAAVDACKVVVNPLGVDIDMFSQSSCRTGAPKFLFVGNPLSTKGLDRLINSFSRLSVEEPSALLYLVGDHGSYGAEDRHPWLRPQGKLDHRQLADLMSKIDYLVMPSALESFGLVALEALSSGMSLLISDKVGVGGVLPAGEWCVTFSHEVEGALDDALRAACARVDFSRQLDATARSLASAFGWQAYRERALGFLEPLLKNQKQAA